MRVHLFELRGNVWGRWSTGGFAMQYRAGFDSV